MLGRPKCNQLILTSPDRQRELVGTERGELRRP
jgi:hypothetical protein